MRRTVQLTASLLLTALLGWGQLKVSLNPETVQAFQRYSRESETKLKARWDDRHHFLLVEDQPEELRKVLAGDLYVRPSVPDNPVSISKGLVHDWIGSVYIPHSSMSTVLEILQNF